MSSSFLSFVLLALLALTITAQVHLPLAPIPKHTFHFVSLGDWGSINKDQAAVARQIGESVAVFNASVLLAVGDNFYEDGVANDTDPQWQHTYREVYTAKSLDIPWYAILGNHDHHLGRGQAEIDYYCPYNTHTTQHSTHHTARTLHLIDSPLVDSSPLRPSVLLTVTCCASAGWIVQ